MPIDQNSITITKMNGESGSPCLIPLLLSKKPDEDPFKRIEKVGVDKHSLIHDIHLIGNLKQCMM
jgi:hypothetical protein